MNKVFALENEDLTSLGGPMGTERTSIRWTKYFRSDDAAKRFAEKDYKGPIKWRKAGKDKFTSGDLSHTMFNIYPIRIEE